MPKIAASLLAYEQSTQIQTKSKNNSIQSLNLEHSCYALMNNLNLEWDGCAIFSLPILWAGDKKLKRSASQ